MNCLQCTKETSNPQFCSRSCSAKYTNVLQPKRKPEGKCKTCDCLIKACNTYCTDCRPDRFSLTCMERLTLLTLSKEKSRHKYQIYAQIRAWARKIYKTSDKPKCCSQCGYDKHYEVCHIKAIKDFSDEDLVSEINSLSNLIALCPNCHWEFDHPGDVVDC